MKRVTPQHHDYILAKVPTKGAAWVARKLGLDRQAVWMYANRRGIRFGDVPGYVKISEAAHRAGVTISFAHTAAKRDGVFRLIGDMRKAAPVSSRLGIVPARWADAFARKYQDRQEADEARDAGYLGVNDLVQLWRIGRGTIIRGIHGTGHLASLLEDARIVRGKGTSTGTILMNPHDAERIRAALEAERARARQLVSTKSLAIELGIAQSYAASLGRKLGGELLLYGGRVGRFVTPQAADRIRKARA